MNETEERKGTPPARGQDAHATAGETPALPQGALHQPRFGPRFGEVTVRDRGRLPHWEAEGATYFATFRLLDSLPQSVLDSFRFERGDIVRTAEQKRLDELFSERVEAHLDSGCGACHSLNQKSPRWWPEPYSSSMASGTGNLPGA
jgi:hypothetical protein